MIRNKDSQLLSAEDLEKFPLPAYDLVPFGSYDTLCVETSRGCRYSCAFCSIQHRRGWRGFGTENVLYRVESAKKSISRYNIQNFINFSDDCFTEDPDRAVQILEALREKQDGFSYFVEARVSDLMQKNLVERINPDSILQMQIGVECGYNDGLRRIHKGTTIEQLYECLSAMKETGLNRKVFLSFIIGFPWESEEDIKRTLNTVWTIASQYNTTCNVNWLFMLPSEIWDKREKYGINVSENLFDDFLWHAYPDYFYTCHPNISKSAFRRISIELIKMKAQSDYVTYRIPVFLRGKMVFGDDDSGSKY